VIRTRTTTLFDPSSVAPYGSEAWARECKKKLEDAVDRAVGGKLEFDRDVRQFWDHHGWKVLKNAQEQPFASFREFAMAPRPYGLHIPPKAYKGFMQDIDKAMEEVIEDAEAHPLPIPGNPKGHNQYSPEELLSNNNSYKINRQGTSADYLARRIARDRPDILERMKAGDYKSVRAAARDADIKVDATPLQLTQRAWKHATLEDKKLIVGWIQDQLQSDPDLLEHLA